VLGGAVLLLPAAFFAGAVGHARCAFPFCSGIPARLDERIRGRAPAPARVLATSLHEVEAREVLLPATPGGYAAAEVVRGGLLVAAKRGALLRVDSAGAVRPLPFSIPYTRTEFDRQTTASGLPGWFAVKDIRVLPGEDRARLLASFHHWDPGRRCFTLRLAQAELPAALERASATVRWRMLYQTHPCLPIKPVGWPFAGHEAGGRIEPLPDGRILLSVGDHEFDGVHAHAMAMDSTASYGKTIAIDPATGEARTFTDGHRNPQGLFVDGSRIWETEHGPVGGDELNLLREGGTYGWPRVSYGTIGGGYLWHEGAHPGFLRPVFAWVPSIGVSQVIVLHGRGFPRWRGDLLVSSLRAATLFRLRVEEGRVILAEPIPIGQRIRDLTEAPDGSVVLVLETDRLLVLRAKV
jgi:hypothetical protein